MQINVGDGELRRPDARPEPVKVLNIRTTDGVEIQMALPLEEARTLGTELARRPSGLVTPNGGGA